MERLSNKKLGPSTYIGAGIAGLMLILGLATNTFLAFLGVVFFTLLLTGLYTVVTGRGSWLRLSGRGAGGVVLAAGAVAWMASWAAFGATLPKAGTDSSQQTPPSVEATVSVVPLPSVEATTSSAPSPSVEATASSVPSPSVEATVSTLPSPSPSVKATASSAPAPPVAPFGQEITLPSGYAVKMSYLGRFTPGPLAFGAEDGKITAFEVTVRNGTTRQLNMVYSSIPVVTYGPDRTDATAAGDVTIEGDHSFLFPTLEPGQAATMKFVCGIPERGLGDVRAVMNNPDLFKQNLGDESALPAVFEGRLE